MCVLPTPQRCCHEYMRFTQRQECENILHIDRGVISNGEKLSYIRIPYVYGERYEECVYVMLWDWETFFESYILFSSDILSAYRISRNLQFHCHQIIIANVIVNGNLAPTAGSVAIATSVDSCCGAVVVWYKYNKRYWLCEFPVNLCLCMFVCVCVCVFMGGYLLQVSYVRQFTPKENRKS